MKINGIYKCKARNLSVRSEGERTTEINGEHQAQKTNSDVQIFIIENQVCHYLPKDLDLHFPKIYHLDIRNTGLKAVTSDDMKMFPMLKHLYIRNNEIEVLPNDLFHHNSLLEFINLNDNKIKQVGSNTFDGLPNLASLDIERNICIDDFALQEDAIKKFKKKIARSCQLVQTF